MATHEKLTVIRVFLASPGDLKSERLAAKDIVDEINATLSKRLGYTIELIGWEDTIAARKRAQALINKDLEKCELVIGLVAAHWGTPPDVDSKYTSGFEEEYELSIQRNEATGSPEISIFFKVIEPERLSDPGEQLKKVIEFRNKLIAEKKSLFEDFKDDAEFQKRFRRCIIDYLLKTYEAAQATQDDQDNAKSKKISSDNSEKAKVSGESNQENPTVGIIQEEAANFLENFLAMAKAEASSESISPAEIARFRLVATSITKAGNDNATLGAHDANILYSQRAKFEFSRPEIIQLTECGLEHFEHKNIPLWHWLKEAEKTFANFLLFKSLYFEGDNQLGTLGAFGALKLIDINLPEAEEDLSRNVFTAIKNYLNSNGMLQ